MSLALVPSQACPPPASRLRTGARRPRSDAELRAVWMLRCALCTHEPRGDAQCREDLIRLGVALHGAFAALRRARIAPPSLGVCGAIGLTPDEAVLLRATQAVQDERVDEAACLLSGLTGTAPHADLAEVIGLLAAMLGSAGYWLPDGRARVADHALMRG